MSVPMLRRSLALALVTFALGQGALAQAPPVARSAAPAPSQPGAPAPADERALGEFVVTGVVAEHIPKIAILPSLSPALEDVVVRSVVRRDLEISGLFEVLPDRSAPRGAYGFNDPVNVGAWQSLGAEAVVKVAARAVDADTIEVLGLAYFPSAGPEPVYETRQRVRKADARRTAHLITDALLGALTGRPGGFASRFTYSGAWGRNRRIFTVDSDGHGLEPRTPEDQTAIAPAFGPGGALFFTRSKSYSPFRLRRLDLEVPGAESTALPLAVPRSIYAVAFDRERRKLAVAAAVDGGSAIFVGAADGSGLTRVSTSEVATHPAFSPSGKLAWVGGRADRGEQRIYVDGKPVSPAGFAASAPTFCDTEDGVFLVYSVRVGTDRTDLVMSGERGGSLQRLTQNQGSNGYPACSPDGRLLAFFSTRAGSPGLYVLSLKRWTTTRVLGSVGESLRWDPLPPEQAPEETEATTPAPPSGSAAP
jgi:TolB protein